MWSRLEAVQNSDIVLPTQVNLACNASTFKTLMAAVDFLRNPTILGTVKWVTDQVGYIAIRDEYIGCLSTANSLLATYTNEFVTNSRDCASLDVDAYAEDPCCQPQNDWLAACLPHRTTATATSIKSNEARLKAEFMDPECVHTFAADYAATALPNCTQLESVHIAVMRCLLTISRPRAGRAATVVRGSIAQTWFVPCVTMYH